ncbi:MAG: hypothetical protein WD894_24920 [Pirellulales bacterium]
MTDEIPIQLRELYAEAYIRGLRITRLEEQRLGYFRLDAATAWQLGRNNLGVFIGGCHSVGRIVELLRNLEQRSKTPRWVIVADHERTAAVVIDEWFQSPERPPIKLSTMELPRVHSNIFLATPETLRRIPNEFRQDICSVIVIDLPCQIYKMRGFRHRSFYVRNDRPQFLANFRNSNPVSDWLPPLILFTHKHAKSLETSAIARAYCLDGWWFVDGSSLRCGAPPDPTRQTRMPG